MSAGAVVALIVVVVLVAAGGWALCLDAGREES